MEWTQATDIKRDLADIIKTLKLTHVKPSRIFCYRSTGSVSHSYARIWSFPKIFQQALSIEPAYVIEALAKHYDKLNRDQQKQVLIHELLHIPKNFSGALLSHRSNGRRLESTARKLFAEYKNLKG